jgi:hypothetical protein
VLVLRAQGGAVRQRALGADFAMAKRSAGDIRAMPV